MEMHRELGIDLSYPGQSVDSASAPSLAEFCRFRFDFALTFSFGWRGPGVWYEDGV